MALWHKSKSVSSKPWGLIVGMETEDVLKEVYPPNRRIDSRGGIQSTQRKYLIFLNHRKNFTSKCLSPLLIQTSHLPCVILVPQISLAPCPYNNIFILFSVPKCRIVGLTQCSFQHRCKHYTINLIIFLDSLITAEADKAVQLKTAHTLHIGTSKSCRDLIYLNGYLGSQQTNIKYLTNKLWYKFEL